MPTICAVAATALVSRIYLKWKELKLHFCDLNLKIYKMKKSSEKIKLKQQKKNHQQWMKKKTPDNALKTIL